MPMAIKQEVIEELLLNRMWPAGRDRLAHARPDATAPAAG
jgi:hypothetical protein